MLLFSSRSPSDLISTEWKPSCRSHQIIFPKFEVQGFIKVPPIWHQITYYTNAAYLSYSLSDLLPMLIKAFVWKPKQLSIAQTLHDFPALNQSVHIFW